MKFAGVLKNGCYILWLFFLTSCTYLETSPLTSPADQESEIVATATFEIFDAISPVPGETPYPFSLEEVTCQFEGFTIEPDVERWTDSLIPGTSTIDDLLAVHEINEEPQRQGPWGYSFGNSHFSFYDGILLKKTDARSEFKKIISHYGYPEKIIWEIPNLRSFDIGPVTKFIYPQDNAYFYTTGVITQLHPEISLYSLIFTPENFQSMLVEQEDGERIKYEYFYLDWPCQ